VTTNTIHVLSGGAAHGVVAALTPAFTAASGAEIAGTFGAVGAMKAKLLAGDAADVLILTRGMIADLTQTGHAVAGSARDLGVVKTAVAVRTGDPIPDTGSRSAFAAALAAADAIYFPDPKLATAGIHVAKVLRALGIDPDHDPRIRTFPNGATAMRALAAAPEQRPIGSTQITEILTIPGVASAGMLPKEFELATVYTAAITTKAAAPDLARRLIAMLASPRHAAARAQAGFEEVYS
jgi:molybdate transport system substrate-binding protein